MDFQTNKEQQLIRKAVREICNKYPNSYWRELDSSKLYPEDFVQDLTKHGWLSILIPEEFGGGGLGITEASIVLEEINRSGGHGTVCHAQMYTMGTLLKHGNDEQKNLYLPKIASGELKFQAFAVTEPDAGSDTTRIKTTAIRNGNHYIINGQKTFISRVHESDLMLLLARTTPYDKVHKKTDGLSIFLVDLKEAKKSIDVQPIEVMFNHHTNNVFFDNLLIPAENLIGDEGNGFRHIIDSWNPERILIAAEAIGDGYWFVDKTVSYANKRVIFDQPIGSNQGIQFPVAKVYSKIEAANLMRFKAASKFDNGDSCGPEANMAKLLAAEAAWEAANVAMDTHGGYGFATDYDIERKFRETRLLVSAPVSTNMILSYIGQHVLGMPRSY